jgi:hypothetical protein
VFHHTRQDVMWDIRLGMPALVSAAVIYTATLGMLAHAARRARSDVKRLAAVAIVFAAALALPVHWQRHTPAGLPGYERMEGVPPTAAYRWVRAQTQPLRVYAAGLRPYGLVGRDWQNVVFGDLHSEGLADTPASQARLAAVVIRFQPDVVLVSVDPHWYAASKTKPAIVNWLGRTTNCFEEVYSDDGASVFRVRPGAATALAPLVPPGYVLRPEG